MSQREWGLSRSSSSANHPGFGAVAQNDHSGYGLTAEGVILMTLLLSPPGTGHCYWFHRILCGLTGGCKARRSL